MQDVGILHPGAMGISVAATMRNGGHTVLWCSAGRGPATAARAADHDLVDTKTMAALCARAGAIVSVCPPAAAEAVAAAALGAGFRGLYVDANAISPQRAQHIGRRVTDAGAHFVDGSIVGGPAWRPGTTWLYLSGPEAAAAADLFAAGPLETEILDDEIGRASALKMCFAANSKGTTALLALVLAAAESLGVRAALERQWDRYDPDFAPATRERARRVTAKAWRFEGEMREMVDTFAAIGLPDGFHAAAAEIYRRLAGFKDAAEAPALSQVLAALNDSDRT